MTWLERLMKLIHDLAERVKKWDSWNRNSWNPDLWLMEIIGRKPPLWKPVISKNITEMSKLVIGRWYSNSAKHTAIIKTVRQVISFMLILWKLAFLTTSPSPLCQYSYFSIILSIAILFLFLNFIYPLVFSLNFPEHLKANTLRASA